MTTSETLKNIRLKLCVNKSEFAEMIGVNRSSISYYESGRSQPSFSTVRKIMKVAKEHGVDVKLEDIRED